MQEGQKYGEFHHISERYEMKLTHLIDGSRRWRIFERSYESHDEPKIIHITEVFCTEDEETAYKKWKALTNEM